MDLKWGLLLASFCFASPAAADFAADEFPPYERCAICHGLFGVSHTAKFPNLGGQKPAYLAAQIQAFLDGTRTNDSGQMSAIVTELKPEEIPVVIEWFSTQDAPKPAGLPEANAGQTAFADLGCAECHTNGSEPPDVPYLTAQHAGYLAKQMRDFKTGARATGEIASMHSDLLQLPDDKLGSIADYLAAKARQ